MLEKPEEEKGVTEDEMVGWRSWLNGHEFEQTSGDSEGREAWSAAVHGVAKLDMTEWPTNLNVLLILIFIH